MVCSRKTVHHLWRSTAYVILSEWIHDRPILVITSYPMVLTMVWWWFIYRRIKKDENQDPLRISNVVSRHVELKTWTRHVELKTEFFEWGVWGWGGCGCVCYSDTARYSTGPEFIMCVCCGMFTKDGPPSLTVNRLRDPVGIPPRPTFPCHNVISKGSYNGSDDDLFTVE